MMEGDYSLLWGTSSLFSEGSYKVLKSGWLQKTTIATITFNVPEAYFGIYFVQFYQPNRDAVNAQFTVRPSLQLTPTSTTAGSKVVVKGTGFPASDKGNILMLNNTYTEPFSTSSLGSFSVQLTMPDLSLGSHQIKAHSQKLSNEFVTTSIEIVSRLSQPLQIPATTVPTNPPGTQLPAGGTVTVPVNPSSKAGLAKPVIISPRRDSFGWFGAQPVTFRWGAVTGIPGVSYNLEIGGNFSFKPEGLKKNGLAAASSVIELPPGTYYWRVQAVDGQGNAGEWAYSPYAFKVGNFPIVPVAVAAVFLGVMVYVGMLIRNYSRRDSEYYY
ncbi:MAG TPA: hypothetical protein VJ488_04025 [Dehalococcoidia bacterium]|nr:hypothetical protein [Dehalococcoidia bacterium]